jgi:hypothetical protein
VGKLRTFIGRLNEKVTDVPMETRQNFSIVMSGSPVAPKGDVYSTVIGHSLKLQTPL